MCDVSHDTPTSILLCVIHLQEYTLYYYVCIHTKFKLLCVMLVMIHPQECTLYYYVCIHTKFKLLCVMLVMIHPQVYYYV